MNVCIQKAWTVTGTQEACGEPWQSFLGIESKTQGISEVENKQDQVLLLLDSDIRDWKEYPQTSPGCSRTKPRR